MGHYGSNNVQISRPKPEKVNSWIFFILIKESKIYIKHISQYDLEGQLIIFCKETSINNLPNITFTIQF